jgi:hypothetical protein
MYAFKPCTTPFFYTPAPGLSFDNKGYLSAVSDYRTAQGLYAVNQPKKELPWWPVPFAKIYPLRDQTNDYFMAYPDTGQRDCNARMDVTANWPRCAYPLR